MNPETDPDVVTDVTDETFESEVLGSSLPVLVDFWAPWCGPCLQVAPILEALARENDGRLRFVRLNVDENPVTAAAYRITGMPTLDLFENGEVVREIRGARPRSALVHALEGYVDQPRQGPLRTVPGPRD